MTAPPDEPFPDHYFGGPPPTQRPTPEQAQPIPAPYPYLPYPNAPYPNAPYPNAPYPTYSPYGPPDPASITRRLRMHRMWATLAQVAILIDVVLHLLVIRDVGHQRDIIHQISNDPLSVTDAQATAADHAARVALVLVLVFLAAAGACLIVWLYRLCTDAEQFAPGERRLSPGWAIGGWFIPFANLVLPFLVFRGVIKSLHTERDRGTRSQAGTYWLVGVWWAAWVIGGVGSRLVHVPSDTDSLSAVDGALRAVVLLFGLEAGAGLLAIVVIEVLTRANRRRWSLLAAPRP